MTDPVRRSEAWLAKMDTTIIKARLDARLPSMGVQMQQAQTELYTIEQQTKAVMAGVAPPGISPIFVPFYLSFSRECYKAAKKFSGTTAVAKITAVADKWEGWGLNRALMIQIAAEVHDIIFT